MSVIDVGNEAPAFELANQDGMETLFPCLLMQESMFFFGGIQKLIRLAERSRSKGSVIESKTSKLKVLSFWVLVSTQRTTTVHLKKSMIFHMIF